MTGRTVLIVILSVVCGLAAAAYATTAIHRGAPPAETAPAVVAAVDVKAGTKLTAEMVKVKAVARDAVPPGAVQRLEDAVGRAAEMPLLKDDFVLEGKLTSTPGAGLAVHVPPGMRAKAIPLPGLSASVAGGIRPRDRADVKCFVEKFYPKDESGGGVVTVLQNVEVARVDNKMEAAPAEDGKVLEQREVKTVTLVLTPEEADLVELAERYGKLSLHLRNAADDEQRKARPVTMANLPFPPPPRSPAKAPPPDDPAPPPIRVLRATSEGATRAN